jgi:hypothetical protein
MTTSTRQRRDQVLLTQPDREGIWFFYLIQTEKGSGTVLLPQPDREGTGEKLIITVSSIKKESVNIVTF